MIMTATAPSTVVFTHGRRQWTAWAHGVQTARAAALVAAVLCRRAISKAFAPKAGTCRLGRNGTPCSRLWAVHQSQGQNSCPRPVGLVMTLARMISPFRRCLLASGTTMGITTMRAIFCTSGVLQSSIAAAHTAWTCSTSATMCT